MPHFIKALDVERKGATFTSETLSQQPRQTQ